MNINIFHIKLLTGFPCGPSGPGKPISPMGPLSP